jgi:hypothetical protein
MITTDQTLLSWVNGYKIHFEKPVTQSNPNVTIIRTEPEKAHYNAVIKQLITIGAISECKPCPGQFVSRVFLIPKKDGTMRFILNLKELNKFIKTKHFKMEDIRTVLKLVSKKCYMATIDLKDAYMLIKIDPSSCKYLRFIIAMDNNLSCSKMYEFKVLPFGLCTAPYIFTKLLKPVLKLIRTCGFLSSCYLDDICLMGDTYFSCMSNVGKTQELLEALGFILNRDKSCMTPSQSCKYLGFVVDSKYWHVSLPKDKRNRIKTVLKRFLHVKRCRIRNFAQLVGLLVSACPAVEYGWMHTKSLERIKYLQLKKHNNYNFYMKIPNNILSDIRWWIKVIDNSVHRIRDDTYCCEIFSDASTTGWGAACGNNSAGGQWTETERSNHINYLELLAAYFALKLFARNCHHCQILLRVDNTTAVSYINRMGGIQYPHLTELTRSIWQWCEKREIYVTACYIKSADNSIADMESRRSHPDAEWTLLNTGFRIVVSNFGFPEIDLFADRINKKCNKYASWKLDPDALVIDAFTISWSDYYFYAFPPVSCVLKALRKIINDKAVGIVVVPAWPSQPWYPLFTSLIISKLIKLDSSYFFIPHSRKSNIQETTTLVAAILSGRQC